MAALNQQFGQPHQLALQRIAELMDGPNILSGDVKSFRTFALKVRSLVSMLEQLGRKGTVELECGSHVSRLLGKLPHDMRSSFRRFIHPQRVPIPTLLDLSDWLEFEIQVQVDTSRFSSCKAASSKREQARPAKPSGKSAAILLSTEHPQSEMKAKAPTSQEKGKKYCAYCDHSRHTLNNCQNFKQLTTAQKQSWIKDNNRCWRCGRAHRAAECDLKMACKTCNNRHLLVLHGVNSRAREKANQDVDNGPKPDSCLLNTAEEVLYVDRPPGGRSVLLKVSQVLLRNGDRTLETYAVLDDGSERTILLYAAAQQLGLDGQPEDLPLRTVRRDLQVLHGLSVSFTLSPASQPRQVYQIKGAFTAKELGLAEHTHPVDSLVRKYRHLQGLPLQTVNKAHPLLLIGSDYPHLITPVEPVRLGPPGGPAAIKTRLGWTLQGPAQTLKHWITASQCYFTSTRAQPEDLYSHVERLWQMDVLPWRNAKASTRSRLDQQAVALLETKTVRLNIEGVYRYATPLLRASSLPQLCAPKESVLPQLRSTEKRLAKAPEQAAAYIEEIRRLKTAGYVVQLEPGAEDTPTSWYIPHHMVQHNGKNRVVFNCSFQFHGHNLNKFLLPGPTLGPSLLAVLLRFREHSVAISSDIRGMFHQVRLLPEDWPLLRFLWRDLRREEPPRVYEWRVLPFGTTSSPCCAIFALQKHVLDHSQSGDEVQEAVLKSFYVDNCLRSLSSEEEARALVDRLQVLLAEGGFELRQWASNRSAVINHLPSEVRSVSSELWIAQGQPDGQESALGLQWHCQSDTLSYKLRTLTYPQPTLRVIYKVLASQYDPIGYLVPFTTRAKVVVQQLWAKQREWDDPDLPADLLQTWKEWERELPELQTITLPRCYSGSELDNPSSQRDIHVFCDASEKAYGSVAYLRTEDLSGNVETAFLTARSRVAPKKQQTIPRLELCAALTGAQLASVLATELTLSIRHVILWTDSTTVLTWLNSESCRYKVFVGTRVAEIQDLTDGNTWRYVDSANNPADDITRGKTLAELRAQSCWYQGPPFLREAPEQWPETPPATYLDSEELRKATLCNLTIQSPTSGAADVSSYTSLAELLEATIQSLHGAAGTTPSASDYKEAENHLLQQAQEECFPLERAHLKAGKPLLNSSRLLTLAPELDSTTQLIRVGGRLRRCTHLDTEAIHPIVLDHQHPLTQLIIKDLDEKLRHPGPERVFAEVRRRYWILRGREAIRRYQRGCTDCCKWRSKPEVPQMADLPQSRLRLHQPAFYSTGVDCFGPYLVTIGRRKEKRWGIIFKCMTTRAVYLDLLSGVDTDSFLMAFRRFSSRRGTPFELISDRGTNFRGGERELREAFTALQPDLQAQLAKEQIQFRFNPPNAPHFGGCWEREIRSLKQALQATIGAQSVTEEVLRTVLAEIEGILNAKPLGYVSSDIADPDPVTPNSLLMGRPAASLPQVVYPETEILSRRRWRHSQLLADHFWQHFIKYYLPGLQTRQKWTSESTDLQVGVPVMIVDPQLPRALWPMGKISQVIPGPDNRVRTVEVRVGDSTYTRPVARVIRLPVLPD